MTALKRTQIISFLILLLVVLIIVLLILKPFFNLLALALIIAILFGPVYRWFLKVIRYPSWSSLATVLVILLIIAIPVWLFGQIIFNEATQLYSNLKSGELVISRSQLISSVPAPLQGQIENFSRNLNDTIANFTGNLTSSLSAIISNIAGFVASFVVLFILVFFLLRDGEKIKTVFMDISPIATSQEKVLFERIHSAVNGVVKGQFLVALCQGAMATLGFIVFGVPQPLLWGLFTVLAALVPFVGTSLSVGPAVIYLFITGHAPQAFGLLIWEVAFVGTIDNFLGPKFVGGSLRLHPALVLLAVIGGLKFFGVLGFLIGPIFMAIFVELINMYRTEFRDYVQG